MFGFLFGTACLIGIFAVVRGRRRWHGHGYWGGGGRGRGPFGGRGVLYGVLSRLDTTPGQEKAIGAAVDEFVDSVRKGRGTLKQTREALAQAVRGETFDESKLREAFVAQDAALDEAREAAVASAQKIHEVLDERQRKALADLIESGPEFGQHGDHHHYYGHHHHGWGHRSACC